jgi:putative membrane protein
MRLFKVNETRLARIPERGSRSDVMYLRKLIGYVMRVPSWRLSGREPDYRFSLANERTFLAWIRTALALLAGGVLLEQFATKLEPRHVVIGLAVGLAVLSSFLCAVAYLRWKANEMAMRHGRPLPPTIAIPLLALSAAIVSGVIAAVESLK